MPAAEFQLPTDLRELILSGKCIAFVGSGLSTGEYFRWAELVEELCCECKSAIAVTPSSTPQQLLDAAADAKRLDKVRYFEVLGKHFGKAVRRIPLVYTAIVNLPFRNFITVNFDPLLARQSGLATLRCAPEVRKYPNLDRNMEHRSVHYIHGLIAEGEVPTDGTIVLSTDEFTEAYKPDSPLRSFLIPTLENDPLLFAGCSLREPTMGRLFELCKERQLRRVEIAGQRGEPPSSPPPRFILLPEENDEDRRNEMTSFYEELQIRPVWYPPDDEHLQLQLGLERVAPVEQIEHRFGWKPFS